MFGAGQSINEVGSKTVQRNGSESVEVCDQGSREVSSETFQFNSTPDITENTAFLGKPGKQKPVRSHPLLNSVSKRIVDKGPLDVSAYPTFEQARIFLERYPAFNGIGNDRLRSEFLYHLVDVYESLPKALQTSVFGHTVDVKWEENFERALTITQNDIGIDVRLGTSANGVFSIDSKGVELESIDVESAELMLEPGTYISERLEKLRLRADLSDGEMLDIRQAFESSMEFRNLELMGDVPMASQSDLDMSFESALESWLVRRIEGMKKYELGRFDKDYLPRELMDAAKRSGMGMEASIGIIEEGLDLWEKGIVKVFDVLDRIKPRDGASEATKPRVIYVNDPVNGKVRVVLDKASNSSIENVLLGLSDGAVRTELEKLAAEVAQPSSALEKAGEKTMEAKARSGEREREKL